MIKIFFVALLLVCAQNFTNPAILLSVPFPLAIPTIDLSLPFSINDVLVNSLELSNIYARQIDYTWKLNATKGEVKISHAKISFNWQYKKDEGTGYFTEENLEYLLSYQIEMDSNKRLKISLNEKKLKTGSSKVTFGGPVKQTVALEVTNLILNHASITFRSIIANKIENALKSLTEPFGKDVTVYHIADLKKDIKINTTLVTKPYIHNQTLIIQMNGAPYIEGSPSGELNPQDALVLKQNKNISIQFHTDIVDKIVEILMKASQLNFIFNTADISSVLDLNSLTLSSVFPHMENFSSIKNVIFQVKVEQLQFKMSTQGLNFAAQGEVVIFTEGLTEKIKILYMDPVQASAAVGIVPIFGFEKSSIRVRDISIDGFNPTQQDIQTKKIVPNMLSQYFQVLTAWASDAINFALNKKSLQFSFNNIAIKLDGHPQTDKIYILNINLKNKYQK